MAAEPSRRDPASREPSLHDLLLEVRAEEIPARMLRPAVDELESLLRARLEERGLGPASIETAFTPRRLVLVARGVAGREPDREEQVTGPPVAVAFEDGKPTPAALGFAKRCGVEPGALQRVETDKGEYVAAVQHTAGRPTREVLAEVLPDLLQRLTWSKTMRWGAGEGPWVRPVHGVLALFGGEVVPFSLFGVEAGRETVGHPVLSPQPFAVDGEEAYRQALSARAIEVRPAARAERLHAEMTRHAEQVGGELVEDPVLLEKLAAICEIPGVLLGAVDEEFLELPREVLVESLREHQSAFTVQAPPSPAPGAQAPAEDGEPGRLLPWFLTVMDRPDDAAGRVRSGNEWVVAARLADARFFYREDRKRPLAERRGDLARLTFHARLGSYLAKSERLEKLVETLCGQLGWGGEVEHAVAAAGLAKVDLTCEMVKEFTDLQGVMGGIYAREEGSPEPVWQAIYDQYLPASADDPLPRGRAGLAVALADRLNTLVGMFGLGLVPSGSRDPFGLRRAAQGVVRIALEGELPVDLDLLTVKAARLYRDQIGEGFADADAVLASLRPFLDDRVRHVLGLAGYAYDEIEAALAVATGDLTDLAARVAALHEARGREPFLSVVLAAKRIANILRDQEEQELDAAALVEPAEKDLHAAWRELRGEIDEASAAGDYARALEGIAGFAEVLDRFFVEVLVMAEDRRLRRNRIALLQAIHRTVSRVARLTEVVVDKDEYRKT